MSKVQVTSISSPNGETIQIKDPVRFEQGFDPGPISGLILDDTTLGGTSASIEKAPSQRSVREYVTNSITNFLDEIQRFVKRPVGNIAPQNEVFTSGTSTNSWKKVYTRDLHLRDNGAIYLGNDKLIYKDPINDVIQIGTDTTPFIQINNGPVLSSNVSLNINGSFSIDQEGRPANIAIGANNYFADMWKLGSETAHNNLLRVFGRDNVPECGYVPTVTFKSDGSLADLTTLGNNGLLVAKTFIEPQTYVPLHGGNAMTLSFWVKSNVEGRRYVVFTNHSINSNRYSYIADFNISNSDPEGIPTGQWGKVRITLPSNNETLINWVNTNDMNSYPGMEIWFVLDFNPSINSTTSKAASGAGSKYQWLTSALTDVVMIGTDERPGPEVNYYTNPANEISFAAVKLEKGSQASAYQPVIYHDELSKCKRFYETSLMDYYPDAYYPDSPYAYQTGQVVNGIYDWGQCSFTTGATGTSQLIKRTIEMKEPKARLHNYSITIFKMDDANTYNPSRARVYDYAGATSYNETASGDPISDKFFNVQISRHPSSTNAAFSNTKTYAVEFSWIANGRY